MNVGALMGPNLSARLAGVSRRTRGLVAELRTDAIGDTWALIGETWRHEAWLEPAGDAAGDMLEQRRERL